VSGEVPAPRRVVLWRHGRTAWNAEGRFQGQLDVDLDPIGEEQALRAARLLAGLPPAAVVCSDLARARATAQPLLSLTGLAATYEPGLRETHGGAWQGLTGPEMRAGDATSFTAWRHGSDLPAGGTGERRSEVGARASEVVRRALGDRAPGEILVVVTHGGTARATIGTLVGLPVEHWDVFGGLANCSWSVLEETPVGGWRLAEHNAGTLPEPVVGDDV
jgi:probable phosphoglycerate mutase